MTGAANSKKRFVDNKTTSNPLDHDEQGSHALKIASLALAFIGISILFIVAFIGFQPDQFSLSDRYFPSPTVTPTRTHTPTPTPNWTATQKVVEATGTAQAVQTIIANVNNTWTILFSDPFDNNDNHWNTGLDKSNQADVRREINNGKYTWDAVSKKPAFSLAIADTANITDFILSVDLQHTGGTKSSDCGVVFRKDTDDNLYYLGITDNRKFHVALTYNGGWADIINRTTSNALHADETNRVTVIANGSHFIVLFNDQFVVEFEDDYIPRGTVGLGILIFNPEQQANFEFDNFELRTP